MPTSLLVSTDTCSRFTLHLTNAPAGEAPLATQRAARPVLAVFAQWEREIIGQRTSEALRVKIEADSASPAWELRVTRVVRRRIVEMAAAGMSQRGIANKLNADGVPAVGGCWHRGAVICVLRQAAA